MLTINETVSLKQILAVKPQFILAVDYNNNLGDMMGEDTNNEYLAEMTIQHYSLLDNACLAFTVECLISVIDGLVVIEQMDTCCDMQAVYSDNIESLPNGSHQVWGHDTDSELHLLLVELIENQPIYDAPNNFIIEAY